MVAGQRLGASSFRNDDAKTRIVCEKYALVKWSASDGNDASHCVRLCADGSQVHATSHITQCTLLGNCPLHIAPEVCVCVCFRSTLDVCACMYARRLVHAHRDTLSPKQTLENFDTCVRAASLTGAARQRSCETRRLRVVIARMAPAMKHTHEHGRPIFTNQPRVCAE